jgi:hypothetical protein
MGAFFELLSHLLDAFLAAGIGQRGGGGDLREAGDVAGHLALQLVDRIDHMLGPADVTDAPAGHGEALAVAVERQCAIQ